jgi:hypothetical protein
MVPMLLPAALLLGSFWVLTQDNLPGMKKSRAAVGALPNGITAFRPEGRGALLRLLAQRSLVVEPVQGKRVPLYRVIPHEQGGITATQAITTFESRGFVAAVSAHALDSSEDVFVVFVRPEDVGTVAGPASTLALLTLALPTKAQGTPAPGGAVGASPHSSPAPSQEPEIDAMIAAGIERALTDEEGDPAALREMGDALKKSGYASAAQKLEKRASDLELRKRLANLARTAPIAAPEKSAPPKTKTNGKHVQPAIVEAPIDVAETHKTDA